MYHFVWIPKYRRKVFIESYREGLKSIGCGSFKTTKLSTSV
ncbi:transposase [Parashewanella spongiae]|nr:transposase [Parashewanella spongiae]MCL1080369.1 transposase [Parashewanella spongiae]